MRLENYRLGKFRFFREKEILLNFFNLVQIINYTMFVGSCIISCYELVARQPWSGKKFVLIEHWLNIAYGPYLIMVKMVCIRAAKMFIWWARNVWVSDVYSGEYV